ncbi:hypothetical protein Tco_0656678 [Tanacetum coccineum]|uniref:Uncharacterized protein n=1 Tax=Tanacetum coccineum TaxID=301880 RepID=A0ABQ4X9E6_9ASTR
MESPSSTMDGSSRRAMGKARRLDRTTRRMSPLSASFNTCRPATTLSHISKLIHSRGLKPTILPMAIMDTCLPATRTVPTLRIMDPLNHLCIVPLLYLMRRSLEVLRKFHWMILGGRFNQLSHVSSPLLSKPGEY